MELPAISLPHQDGVPLSAFPNGTSKLAGLFFTLQLSGVGDSRPPPLHTPLGVILATGEHRNVAALASCWRHCADWTRPGIKPQTFRTDVLCA